MIKYIQKYIYFSSNLKTFIQKINIQDIVIFYFFILEFSIKTKIFID